ncbi:MAG: germination protein YpeB, partial [Clostridia bacterium]|nr:germination protein YpeB [Clostridia bacterium]
LENMYQKNYYELVDNVNSADTSMSKHLASNSCSYQAKMLTDVAQTSKEMQNNIASLPLTGDDIVECVKFINQMSGYTQTLEQKLALGGTLTEKDLDTLNQMHDSLTEMKKYLNNMTQQMVYGYNILKASGDMVGDFDRFTLDFAQIKADGADYPTMIYDGPFADSVVNQEIKGLSGDEVTKEECYTIIDKLFTNISSLKYQGQSDGRFVTYNFMLTNADNQKLYVQATKIGGHILTVSGGTENHSQTISKEEAEKIALDFVRNNGIEDVGVVWSDVIGSSAFFNVAPSQKGVVLYPDLVKVKVDLETGTIIGYDAMTYYTNHTDRTIESANISSENARNKVDDSFVIVGNRLVLAPLEYNREVLCHEFECERNDATYYIYINASTGVEENILKVVNTTDGSKLM